MDRKTTEYSFAELVEDPLVGLLMKSDGVDRRSIELLFERVARSPGTVRPRRARTADRRGRRRAGRCERRALVRKQGPDRPALLCRSARARHRLERFFSPRLDRDCDGAHRTFTA
jgi:hypothetical protein